MSISAIMKNILSFGEILSQSCSQDAGKWDSHSLQNAVKWATYCEQIYRQAVEKGCLQELDGQVSAMSIYLKPATCMKLSVDTLQTATQVLRKNLLQNPGISDKLFEEVLMLYTSQDESFETLIQECSEIAHQKSSARAVQSIRSIFNPAADTDQGRLLAQSQGELLLQHLVQQKNVSSHHDSRFQDYVVRVSRHLTSLPHGWAVLLSLLLVESGENVSECEDIKQNIISWTITVKSSSVLLADESLLTCVCARWEQVYLWYLDLLITWGAEMTVEYGVPGPHPLYSWRPNSGKLSSSHTFTSLVSHWRSLLSCRVNRLRTADKLKDLCLQDDPCVWKDIHKTLTSCHKS